MKKIAGYLLWAVLFVFLIIARIQVNDLREQNEEISNELFQTQIQMSKYVHGVEYLQLNNPKAADSLLNYIVNETE
jgi:hypothetical protein